MTRHLQEAFEDMLAGEPPARVGVGDIVRRGQQRRLYRRVFGSAVAVLALLIAIPFALIDRSAAPHVPAAPTGTTHQAVTVGPTGDGTPGPTASGTVGPTGGPSRVLTPTPNPGHVATTTPAGSAGTTSGAPAVPLNLLADPGFEKSPLEWVVFGPKTTLTGVSQARTGSRALQVTTASTELSDGSPGATNKYSEQHLTVAGRTYEASCWVRATNKVSAVIKLQEYTVAWERAGDQSSSVPVMLRDPGTWTQIRITHVAENSGNRLPLSVYAPELMSDNGAFFVDDCSLTEL